MTHNSGAVFKKLTDTDKITLGRILRITSLTSQGVANNTTAPALRNGLLPLLTLDMLLHASEPHNAAPQYPRHAQRPASENVHQSVSKFMCACFVQTLDDTPKFFTVNSMWREVLVSAKGTYERAKAVRRQSTYSYGPSQTRKAKCLEGLKMLNAVTQPGDTAIYNIRQAAFMLSAIIQVRTSL